MLDRNVIIRLLREQITELQTRFSVKRIGLFGSFKSGNATETSDIDLLVEFTDLPSIIIWISSFTLREFLTVLLISSYLKHLNPGSDQ